MVPSTLEGVTLNILQEDDLAVTEGVVTAEAVAEVDGHSRPKDFEAATAPTATNPSRW